MPAEESWRTAFLDGISSRSRPTTVAYGGSQRLAIFPPEPLVEFQGQERYLGSMARRAPLTVSGSPSDVVSEGLRLLEELEVAADADLEDARPAIAVGLEQARRGELLGGEEVFRTLEAPAG
jgi:hypothetical protein